VQSCITRILILFSFFLYDAVLCSSLFILHSKDNKVVKSSLYLINAAPYHVYVWGIGGIAPPLLTSALDESELSASRPGKEAPVPTAWDTG
jgi:hypothetical protein